MTDPLVSAHSRRILGPLRYARLTLRRSDGRTYLDRWGLSIKRLGGIFVHRMDAPDPGHDLHDHPFWFASIPVVGGYIEERAETRLAPSHAVAAEVFPDTCLPGVRSRRRRFSVRSMRLDECHRIVRLTRTPTWTVVVHGPYVRGWGFYLPTGYMDEHTYDLTVRAERRDLFDGVAP